MSSTSLNTIFSYNDSLSHLTPIQYLLSLFKIQPQAETSSNFGHAKQLLLQYAPLAYQTRLSDSDLKELEHLRLPNSAENFMSVSKFTLGLFVGLHVFALVRPDIKTFSCKMANARSLFKRLWLPLGVLEYARRYWMREQKLAEINSRFEILDPNVRARDIEQLLWKEKSWISKLKKDYTSKLTQIHEETQIKNFRSPQEDLMNLLGNKKKEEVVDIKQLPVDVRQQVEKAEKEIKKEKNYVDSVFIDINDLLEEIEGTEIIFVHK